MGSPGRRGGGQNPGSLWIWVESGSQQYSQSCHAVPGAISASVFSRPRVCAGSPSASCSPYRGLQCYCSSGWFLPFFLAEDQLLLGGPGCPSRWHRACGWTEEELAQRAAVQEQAAWPVSEWRPPALWLLSYGLRAGPPAGGGSLAPCRRPRGT